MLCREIYKTSRLEINDSFHCYYSVPETTANTGTEWHRIFCANNRILEFIIPIKGLERSSHSSLHFTTHSPVFPLNSVPFYSVFMLCIKLSQIFVSKVFLFVLIIQSNPFFDKTIIQKKFILMF